MKDYYEILEVNKNASDDTIKKVFRMLIKKNHPDLFEGDEKVKAEEKVKELNEAYEVLINKESREKYNLELEGYNNENEEALTILMEENEYLKSVIEEKNRLIKEFFDELGMNTNELKEGINSSEYSSENDRYIDNNTMTEGYKLYKRKEQVKRILYIAAMIFGATIFLWIVADINLFKIFIDTFMVMF